jgi:hypothetical protein
MQRPSDKPPWTGLSRWVRRAIPEGSNRAILEQFQRCSLASYN